MISLFLDTSYYNMVISVFEGKKEIYHKEEVNNNDLSMKLLPAIEEAFSSLNLEIESLEKIFVVTGPGSFTGVRIGVTAAKTLAWALGIGVIPISEIELLSSTATDKKYRAVLMDARRDAVYAGMYDENLNCILEDQYCLKKDFIELALSKVDFQDVEFISFDLFEDLNVEKPLINVSKVVLKHFSDISIDPHTLIPNYLKKTEAEEKRNQ